MLCLPLLSLCCCDECSPGQKLLEEEIKTGEYTFGKDLGEYNSYDSSHHFQTSLASACCKQPSWCCASLLCPVCAQINMRYKVLNHVDPGSGWDNYICCQGQFEGNCCFKPGECCESSCPRTCMCLEVFCCPGKAATASSGVIRKKYELGLDEEDLRLIRFNNCMVQLAKCSKHSLWCLLFLAAQDAEDTEDVEGDEDTGDVEDAEDTEDVEDAEDTEDVEDAECAEDVEDTEYAEDVKDSEYAEDTEDSEYAEDTEDTEEEERCEYCVLIPPFIVFCSQCIFMNVSSCITAQTAYEINMREQEHPTRTSPDTQAMLR